MGPDPPELRPGVPWTNARTCRGKVMSNPDDEGAGTGRERRGLLSGRGRRDSRHAPHLVISRLRYEEKCHLPLSSLVVFAVVAAALLAMAAVVFNYDFRDTKVSSTNPPPPPQEPPRANTTTTSPPRLSLGPPGAFPPSKVTGTSTNQPTRARPHKQTAMVHSAMLVALELALELCRWRSGLGKLWGQHSTRGVVYLTQAMVQWSIFEGSYSGLTGFIAMFTTAVALASFAMSWTKAAPPASVHLFACALTHVRVAEDEDEDEGEGEALHPGSAPDLEAQPRVVAATKGT